MDAIRILAEQLQVPPEDVADKFKELLKKKIEQQRGKK